MNKIMRLIMLQEKYLMLYLSEFKFRKIQLKNSSSQFIKIITKISK